MRLVLCYLSMFCLMFSMAAYGMEGRNILKEVEDWLQSAPSLEEQVNCGEEDELLLYHTNIRKEGKGKRKKSGGKRKSTSRGHAKSSKTKRKRPIEKDVSDDPLLQKLYVHWATVSDVRKKPVDEEVVREIRRNFLDRSDPKVIALILQAYIVRYEKEASKASGELYHKRVQYFGMPMHLVHDNKAWYLFGKQLDTRLFCDFFRTMRNGVRKQGGVALYLFPYNEEKERGYFFMGEMIGERLAFCNVIGAKSSFGGYWDFVKKDVESPAQYPPTPIKPKVRNGTHHKKETIHEKGLAQLGKLQRKAVSDGQRNGDYKP